MDRYRTDVAGKTVDMERSTDSNTANHAIRREYIALNWMSTSKWFNYSVTCEDPGYYTVIAMVANQEGARNTVQLTVEDRQYTSGEHEGKGWTHCDKVEFPQKIYFRKGMNTIEMRSGMNVDYMEFAKVPEVSTGVPAAPEKSIAPEVRAGRGMIHISGATGRTVISDASGICVYASDNESCDVSVNAGLYLVRSGDHVTKITVR